MQNEPKIIEDVSTALARERTAMAAERNRLANERTFLAWIRTGLASVGGGVAFIRFIFFKNPTHQLIAQAIGGMLILLGLTIFILALFDFLRTDKQLRLKLAPSGVNYFVTLIAVTLFIISIFILLITLDGI